MSRQRFALVHDFSSSRLRRNGERFADDLSAFLRGSGHKVDVFCATPSESVYSVAKHGRTYRLRMPRVRVLERLGISRTEAFGLRVLVPLALHRYGVVHALTPVGVLAAVACRQPTIFTVLARPDELPRRMEGVAVEKAARWATAIVAPNRSAAAAAATVLRRPIGVLPTGIALDRYVPNLEAREGPPQLLCTGGTQSGMVFLLTAFDRLLERQPEARLAVSGRRSIEAVLRELGPARARIENSLDILRAGADEGPLERYRSAHVTVVPASDDPFGSTLMQSLASGTPVVGTAPGPAEDIIDTEKIGRLVRHGDIDGLTGALAESIELAQDPATPGHCRAHSERWSWARIGPLYEDLYASVSDPHQPSSRSSGHDSDA